MVHREIQLVTLEDYVMKESENNEDIYTQVGEILVGTLNMKRAMQEIIRILLILTIQILIGVLLSCLIDEKWNFKNLFWNYGFIIFWSSYIVVSISIRIAKKNRKLNNEEGKNMINLIYTVINIALIIVIVALIIYFIRKKNR